MIKTQKAVPPTNGAAPADATPESLESRLLRGLDALRVDFNKQLSGPLPSCVALNKTGQGVEQTFQWIAEPAK